MVRHEHTFTLDATPAEVWSLWWLPLQTPVAPGEVLRFDHGTVTIEILHRGSPPPEGLVRHCYYRVPRYLLSRGVAESWELVSDVVPEVSCRYQAITKPPFAMAEGTQVLEDLGDGRTLVRFVETYDVKNRLLRLLCERRVHAFISRANDQLMEDGLRMGVEVLRSVHGD